MEKCRLWLLCQFCRKHSKAVNSSLVPGLNGWTIIVLPIPVSKHHNFVSGLRCHSRRMLLVHLSSCKTLSSLWQQVLQVVDRPSRKSIVQHILRIPGFLRFILTLPRERLLWSSFPTPRSQCGFWEREVLGKWAAVN